jgi:hypothetical protein
MPQAISGIGEVTVISMGDGKNGNCGDANTTTTNDGGQIQATITRSAALEASLIAVWKEIATLEIERLVVLDKDGNRLFEKDGKEDSVYTTPSENKRMIGAAVIHNHPERKGTEGLPETFTSVDLREAITSGVLEESVCNPLMMASFHPLPTGILKQDGKAKTLFLKPLVAMEKESIRKQKATRRQYLKGVIDYEQALRKQRGIYETGINEARKYLRENQQKYGYIYEERTMPQ